MDKNVLFVLCGGCRTFVDCFDSICEHVVTKMFDHENIYMFLYLKLADPGPKDAECDKFVYGNVQLETLLTKIVASQEKYPHFRIDCYVSEGDEISNEDLWSQLKDRNLYTGFFSSDVNLLRAMHCHYNFERCGHYILDKEASLGKEFEYIVYVRPDLFFLEDCYRIDEYSKSLVTLGESEPWFTNDHIAIIPRHKMHDFFSDRIKVYRENTTKKFTMAEAVYWETIQPYEVQSMGRYFIKRC
jgi:hypothetical protein